MQPLNAHARTPKRHAAAEAIAVTGATGKLGRAVIDELLRRRPPASLTALVRDPHRAHELAAQGVAGRSGSRDFSPVRTHDHLPLAGAVEVPRLHDRPRSHENDAAQLVEADAAIARGELSWASGDLRRLIRRPPTPIAVSIAAALAPLASNVT
jgi:nucleoside-diphosphate-sugar epimerase